MSAVIALICRSETEALRPVVIIPGPAGDLGNRPGAYIPLPSLERDRCVQAIWG